MASGSKKVIYAALAGNAAISVTKFVAATLTGSSAMMSEGVHSLVDTGNQVLLLHGIRRSKRPPDAEFPFGHGKEIYFWSFVVAMLIFAVGAGFSIYEGISQLRHPHAVEDPTINYIVLGLAMIFEGFAWYFAWKEFGRVRRGRGYVQAVQEGKDPTMFVVLFEDSAAMAGLVVAFIGTWLAHATGLAWIDGVAAILIGLIMAGTAAWLAYETKSLLIGESAGPAVTADIRRLASARPRVERVNEVLTMHMGPEFVLVNVSVQFRDEESTESIEESAAALDREIKQAHPFVKRVFIEAETPRRAADDEDLTPDAGNKSISQS